jgi:LuxR family maltose regulon positive regulatory protein
VAENCAPQAANQNEIEQMTESILTAKLYIPPPHPNQVPRPRLIERLEEGTRLGRRLTLVSAPAGFGKTTLVSEWARRADRQTVWLSLDEGDNDPVRFLAYLVAALRSIDERIGQSTESLLQSFNMTPSASASPGQTGWLEGPVTALINDVDAAGVKITLVLDDYHLIRAAPVHRVLQLLTEHPLPQLHVAIVTREEPPLPLPRLRVRNQMTEIRERDLRFTLEEAEEFLNHTMALHLSPEAVTALETRTEGWAAGLQLAALSLMERESPTSFITAFAGDDRHVADYLLDEVLDRQPETVQTFLLHTAILDRFSAPLCDALLSDLELSVPSQDLLERLDAANLFLVPLDNRRDWYRYHHLFADLLRRQLQNKHPDRVIDLHRRACRWYEDAQDPEGALHHALAIPDYALAAQVAEQYGVRMLGKARLATLLGWTQQIPDDVLFAHPYLCITCVWVYLLAGQAKVVKRYMQAIETALLDIEQIYVAPEDRFVTRQEMQGHVTAFRAFLARKQGDISGAVAHSQQALAQLPDGAVSARSAVAINLSRMYLALGKLDAARDLAVEAFKVVDGLREKEEFLAIMALTLLAKALRLQGELGESEKMSQRVVELATREDDRLLPAGGYGYWVFGLIHFERNELADAARCLETALTHLQQIDNPEVIIGIYQDMACLALMTGDLVRAEKLFDQSDKLIQAYRLTQYSPPNIVLRGRLCLKRHDLDGATRYAEASGLQTANVIESLAAGTYAGYLPDVLLPVRILLAQDQFDEAHDLASSLAAAAETAHHTIVLIEAEVLLALVLSRKDDTQALERLERALTLAAPEGIARPFVAAGGSIAALLRQAAARGTEPEYVRSLLAALDASADSPLVEPLSERESEVLRLIAAGLSNREIAQELFITGNTVKSHIKNVYGKLGAKSRAQAIARANELNLL